MENYSNLIEAINGLRIQGYEEDFNLKQNRIEGRNGTYIMFHDEFVLINIFGLKEKPIHQMNVLYMLFHQKNINLKAF